MSTVALTMQRAVEVGCRTVRQLLWCPVPHLQCDRPAMCSGQKEQEPAKEQPSSAAETWSAPSTYLIVHISNSTLIDCKIGNETGAPAVTEKQPLMQGTIPDFYDPDRCSCGSASQPPNIEINRSNLDCVIIGHNSNMQVERTEPSEEEPAQDTDDEG